MILGQIKQIVSFHSTLARPRNTQCSWCELNEIFLFIGGQAPSRDYLPFSLLETTPFADKLGAHFLQLRRSYHVVLFLVLQKRSQ